MTSITVSIPIEDLERESQNQTGGLFVTASDSNSNNPVKFSPKAGDEVYNGFSSTITVKSVTDDEIEFELTGDRACIRIIYVVKTRRMIRTWL